MRDSYEQNSKEKSYRECSSIKTLMTGSKPRKIARDSTEFNHPSGFELMSPDKLWLALTTQPYVRVNLLDDMVEESPYLASVFQLFACLIVDFGFLESDIMARDDTPEFFKLTHNLTANLWSTHIIALDIVWTWNIFSTLLNAHWACHRPSQNLELKINKWMVGSNTVDDYFQYQIA